MRLIRFMREALWLIGQQHYSRKCMGYLPCDPHLHMRPLPLLEVAWYLSEKGGADGE